MMEPVDRSTDRAARPPLKILISAFACEPGHGSENGNGWHAVEYFSRRHDVTVMVAPMARPAIERRLATDPLPNARFEYVDLPSWLPGRQLLKTEPPRVYYYLWQILSLPAARTLDRQHRFDVAHHMTYGCYWRPSVLARLGVPYVWGPVGGTQRVPVAFLPTLPLRARAFSWAKAGIEWASVTLDPFVRMTARRAAFAVPNTQTGVRRIQAMGARRIRVLPQVAFPRGERERFATIPVRDRPSPFRIISLGRVLGWKGVHLALHAFADFKRSYPDAEYWHCGGGAMTSDLEALARTLGVADSFRIWPARSRDEAMELLAECDVVAYPTLYDEPGWVVFEGLAAGRPVLLVRGLPDCPGAEKACVMPRTDHPDHTIRDLSRAMLRLATEPELRQAMGAEGRRIVAEHFDMDEWFGQMEDMLYEAARDPRTVRAVAAGEGARAAAPSEPAGGVAWAQDRVRRHWLKALRVLRLGFRPAA